MRSTRISLLAILLLFLGSPSRPAPISVPFHINHTGSIEVNCEMGSQPRRVLVCVIDTGAQNSMASVWSVSNKSMHGATVISYQTPAGKQIAYQTKQTILLGGAPIPATVEVTPAVSTVGTDVLIGEDVLSQFQTVNIDYKNHVLTCETKMPQADRAK
jgi:hypothetical protein